MCKRVHRTYWTQAEEIAVPDRAIGLFMLGREIKTKWFISYRHSTELNHVSVCSRCLAISCLISEIFELAGTLFNVTIMDSLPAFTMSNFIGIALRVNVFRGQVGKRQELKTRPIYLQI